MGKELVGQHSKIEDNEWNTPIRFVESARLVMGSIDIDPASSDEAQQAIKATKHYTLDNSGLDHDWNGRVFMNPPYGRVINEFASKLVTEHESGNLKSAVVLVNACTETKWFRAMLSVSAGVCLPSPRIHFLKNGVPQKNTTKSQWFFYIGDNFEGFRREFVQYGPCLTNQDIKGN